MCSLEELFIAVNIQRGKRGRACNRVRGPGVAVEKLDRPFRGVINDRIVHVTRHCNRRHGDRAVGERFGHSDEVGRHAETLRTERVAGAPETANDFIKHQQNAMCRADLAQAFEVANGGHQHAPSSPQSVQRNTLQYFPRHAG